MGVILDTNVLIGAERARLSVPKLLTTLYEAFGDNGFGVSAVTLTEFSHGLERAETEGQRNRRQAFLDDLMAVTRIYPFTAEIALLAGRIFGQQARKGIVLAFEDLMIGATATHHGFAVVTENVRHFEMIPGLVVKPLRRNRQ